MENNIVKAFFDKYAHNWDQDNLYNEDIVNQLLDNARIIGDIKVLDIGSGTGSYLRHIKNVKLIMLV